MQRRRLDNRRASTTFDLELAGLRYAVTVSYFDDNSLAEIFISNHRAGSASDVAARDAGILASLCLQHGVDLATIARAISRNGDGPGSGVVGAAFDKLMSEVAS